MHSFSLTVVMCGFHAYKNVWKSTTDEVLFCERDIGNSLDTFAVAIKNSFEVVSNIPRLSLSICSIFIYEEVAK